MGRVARGHCRVWGRGDRQGYLRHFPLPFVDPPSGSLGGFQGSGHVPGIPWGFQETLTAPPTPLVSSFHSQSGGKFCVSEAPLCQFQGRPCSQWSPLPS